MEQTIGALIHNRFDFEVTDAVTGEVKQRASAYNIILDTMWTELCNVRNFFYYINLGSGTGTLAKTRTTLFNQFCSRSASAVTQVYAYPVSYCKKSIQLAASDYVGTTITEVGVAAYNNTTLVTHALLQDSEGNPISIAKTATDIVTIYATIFATVNPGTDLDLIGMPSNNYLLRYLGSGGSTGYYSLSVGVGESDAPTNLAMGGTNSRPLGSTSVTTNTTKDPTNKKIVSAVGRLNVNVGNGHLKEITFENVARMILPSAACPAKTYTGVAIGTGDGTLKDFEVPSRNLQEGSLTVYKNSVAQVLNTDYTLSKDLKINFVSSDIGQKALSTSYATGLAANSLGWFFKANQDMRYGTCINGALVTLDTITNAAYGNNSAKIAMSPVEVLLAVPNDLDITFYTVVNNKIVLSPVTIDVQAPSGYKINQVEFSPDGQHLAVVVLNKPLRIYKKDGNVFKYLTTGVPTTINCYSSYSYSTYSTIKYFGDLLIWGQYNTSTLVALKRTGDTYTASTVTGPGTYMSVELSEDGAHLYVTVGGTTVAHYLVDASYNLTRQDGITSPVSLTGLARVSGNIYLGSNDTTLYMLKIVDNTVTVLQTFTDPRNTNYRPSTYGNKPICKLSDTMWGMVYSYLQGGDTPYMFQPLEISARTTTVHEITPPAAAEALTADYTVDGIHKTENYVIDFQITTQFGEGV
ncbi:MAG: hypothetical protein RR382_00890 [Tannerellaceae bacterium]